MSYTQFFGTATLTVDESFNLDSFLNTLSYNSVADDNFLVEQYGVVGNKIDLDFGWYVTHIDNQILIKIDTEESNGNSEVWDFLIDKFAPIMTSELMKVQSTSVCSRNGVDSCVFYVTKEGKQIDSEEMVENYTKNPILDTIKKILNTYDQATVSDNSHENALWAIAMIKHEVNQTYRKV